MTGKDEKPAGSPRLPARAKRPRDFGAPEPKPSRKVALNEVLRTLQDLVVNELNVTPQTPAKPETTDNRDVPEAPPETPNETTLSIEIDSVQESASESPSAQEPEPLTEIELASPPEPSLPVKTIPPEGLQQELPHLDADNDHPSPPEPEPPTTTTTSRDPEPIVTELPELEMVAEPVAEPAPVATPPADIDHNHTPSDIPVLEDVVEETEDVEALANPVEEASAALAGVTALPQAADARKLAIQVAARLNVDLRKAGKPVLASDVIARLAHALEEALAKAGANRDNDALK